jgi:6-phosphogluconolactonase
MSGLADLRIVDSPSALFQAGAEEFVAQATTAVNAQGRCTVALSGGSTPRSLYNLLATTYRERLPWQKMFFFWGDERHVPPDSAESNYRMADEALLSRVPIPAGNVFRVAGEDPDAARAAQKYEQTLREFFRLPAAGYPRFDLILLGMGPDGHTASLFPGTAALGEKSRLVVANWVDKFKTDRITFTLPVINEARMVMFLVSGSDKTQALREVLEGRQSPELFPSKLVNPEKGKLIWLVDRTAAAGLSKLSA